MTVAPFAGVEGALRERQARVGLPFSYAIETTSTNDDAKLAARNGVASGASFVAERQTNGRGRQGRTWHSPQRNLYASFVLRPEIALSALPLLTLSAGLAVADSLRALVPGRSVQIKWPNDVLIDRRKVAGILSEAQIAGGLAQAIIVGVGINVAAQDFPEEIAHKATSLESVVGAEIARQPLFLDLCAALETRLAQLQSGGEEQMLQELRQHDALLGESLLIEGRAGTGAGIDGAGRLLVRFPLGQVETFVAGEVALQTPALYGVR